MKKARRGTAVLLAIALLATACGADDPQGADDPSSPANEPGADPAAADGTGTEGDGDAAGGEDFDPLQPYPSQEGELPTVRMAVALPALSFAPVFIAEDMNFFEHQGISPEFVELQAGATLLQAVIGGSLEIGISATAEFAPAVGQGLDLVSIQNTILQTMQVCVRDDWAAEAGVDTDSPVEERLAALEGATIGVTAPGSASDRNIRWLLETYGGLDPDTDVEFVQVGGPAMAGATDQNQVQAFLLSSPNCQSAESASVLVRPTEIPEYELFVHEVAYGQREWLEENPELATAVATAISMGNNFILEHPDRALELLAERFSSVDPEAFEKAFETNILPVVPRDGLQAQDQWDQTNEVMVEAGFYEELLDTTEGGFWTNEHIDDPSVR